MAGTRAIDAPCRVAMRAAWVCAIEEEEEEEEALCLWKVALSAGQTGGAWRRLYVCVMG